MPKINTGWKKVPKIEYRYFGILNCWKKFRMYENVSIEPKIFKESLWFNVINLLFFGRNDIDVDYFISVILWVKTKKT